MRLKLTHPIWTHFPAFALYVYYVVKLMMAGPFPDQAPIHFGFNGLPNDYGSPWLVFGFTLGFSLFFIIFSLFIDEVWSNQEKIKSFNWFSLFDELVVGALVGINLGYFSYLKNTASGFDFPWISLASTMGPALLLAVALETIRPFRPKTQTVIEGDNIQAEKEFEKRVRENPAFVYWESQNPAYLTLVTTLLPAILFITAVLLWVSAPEASILQFAVGLLLILPYGGLRTIVTGKQITIRFGLPGFRVLRLKTSEIAAQSKMDFSPLKDFGGYGIRFNGQTTAYIFRGTRGVLITTTRGKKYLIGSDRPEQLLAAIRAIAGRQD